MSDDDTAAPYYFRARFVPEAGRAGTWRVWPWLVALYLRLPWRPLAKQMLVVARRAVDPV